MRQGSGTFIGDVSTDTRSRDRQTAAKRLVRDMLANAARLGINRSEIKKALNGELEDGRK